jgi:hypothetical protein
VVEPGGRSSIVPVSANVEDEAIKADNCDESRYDADTPHHTERNQSDSHPLWVLLLPGLGIEAIQQVLTGHG